MPVPYQIYETRELMALYADDNLTGAVPTFWLDQFFTGRHLSDKERVYWEKVSNTRPLAPLVVPTAKGEPIVDRASRVEYVKPAYLKPLDAIVPAELLYKLPGTGELAAGRELSPAEKFALRVNEIAAEHKKSIYRRFNWMAAQAALYGQVTLAGESYPTTVIDFERDPNHTIVLAAGSRWGDTGVSITDDIERWSTMMATAKFGGAPTKMIVGRKAYKAMQASDEIRDLMNRNFKDTAKDGVDLYRGILPELDIFYAGNISPSLEVYVYNEYYTDELGNPVPFMDERDVLLISPAVMGMMVFGGILDFGNYRPAEIFPKMYEEPNPSSVYLLTQSAPLAVPVNPNATLRARVVA